MIDNTRTFNALKFNGYTVSKEKNELILYDSVGNALPYWGDGLTTTEKEFWKNHENAMYLMRLVTSPEEQEGQEFSYREAAIEVFTDMVAGKSFHLLTDEEAYFALINAEFGLHLQAGKISISKKGIVPVSDDHFFRLLPNGANRFQISCATIEQLKFITLSPVSDALKETQEALAILPKNEAFAIWNFLYPEKVLIGYSSTGYTVILDGETKKYPKEETIPTLKNFGLKHDEEIDFTFAQ